MLVNRLRRMQRHLGKWARRQGISCYRLYDKDIPDQPLIVDRYEDAIVVWAFQRTRDEQPEQREAWLATVQAAVEEALEVPAERIWIKHRGRQRGTSQYQCLDRSEELLYIQEQGLSFEVNLSDYLDTGIFLDHRPTRRLVRERAQGLRVLNCFAYTGGFSVAAAMGAAASTTSVDMNARYCAWAARNLALNGIQEGDAHQILRADCMRFLKEAADRKLRYDLIICDPPTFSNSKKMSTHFSVSHDHPTLIRACQKLLAQGGSLLFSCNQRGFSLNKDLASEWPAIHDRSAATTDKDFVGRHGHLCWEFQTVAAP